MCKIRRAVDYTVAQDRLEVWAPTERALPLMHNLKHFAFYTCCGLRVTPPTLLNGSVFQLESFDTNMDENDLYHGFLHKQDALRHLGVKCTKMDNNGSHSRAVDIVLQPRLTSLECAYADFVDLAGAARIVAWNDNEDADDFGINTWMLREGQRLTDALRQLKYLRVGITPEFHDVLNNIGFPNLVLLELLVWNIDVRGIIKSLS